MKTAYTLFRGGGGADLGLEAAGYHSIGGIENNLAISVMCDANFPHAPTRWQDICRVDPSLLPERPTHLHASPSCKNASVANTDAGEAPEDREAGAAVERFIGAWLPETFSLENVYQYRTFAAFEGICAALTRLGYSYEYWHLNAANYGVPQTRKRLILVARRGPCRIQRPPATHCEGGDWFSAPWVGWYKAIEDLIPTLPVSRFADWQLERLPEFLRSTALFDGLRHDFSDSRKYRYTAEPTATLTTMYRPSHMPRAFILDCQDSGASSGLTLRNGDEPLYTVSASMEPKRPARAFLVRGENTQQEWGKGYRADDEPSSTVAASGKVARAFLVSDQSAQFGGVGAQTRQDNEPSTTVRADVQAQTRAWLTTGRVVRMTPRALARFMSIPDSYWLPDHAQLACTVIGNAVCPLLMQRIMESL